MVEFHSVDTQMEKGTGFAGQRIVRLPERVITRAMRQKPLLRGLMVAGAGFFPRASGHLRRRMRGSSQAIFIYCVKGRGWCELNDERHQVNRGELLILPPNTPHTYGANASDPWSIHWVHAVGENVREYVNEFRASPKHPVVSIGQDFQIARLFDEALLNLEHGFSFIDLLRSSAALGHALSLLVQHRRERNPESPDALQRVAQAIVHMNDHLGEPLRVSSLAALVNLSAAHFTVVFKGQTGSSPREYLQLLRVHRACQLLHETTLTVKEIGARLGYNDQFHFSRQFKLIHGMSPTEYRGK